MTIGRRQFVRNTSLALGTALLSHKSTLAAASFDARIDVVLNEELGTISPDIYGHFTENLGGVIYDGVWVGENSKIPNVDGIRKSLVDALQKIKSPVIRWPGGCFADSYDWKDGIGPVAKRPRRTNFWAGDPLVRDQGNIPQKYDPNEFGTNEFVQFCKLDRQPAVPRREPPQPARRRFLSLGRILQFARGKHHACRSCAPRPAARIPSTFATGALATNPGAAAAK